MTTEPARLPGIPVLWCRDPRWKFSKWSQALSIQFNNLISIRNQMERISFGSVWPECLGPPVNRWPVTGDWSSHFGRSDRNVPFHFTKLLSPVPLFCILLKRTITERAVAGVRSVQPECTVPLGTQNFRNYRNLCWIESTPRLLCSPPNEPSEKKDSGYHTAHAHCFQPLYKNGGFRVAQLM